MWSRWPLGDNPHEECLDHLPQGTSQLLYLAGGVYIADHVYPRVRIFLLELTGLHCGDEHGSPVGRRAVPDEHQRTDRSPAALERERAGAVLDPDDDHAAVCRRKA